MELNLRTVLVILGSIIMLGILVDGFRRMRRARRDALSIDVKGDYKFPEDSFPSELPNGGARVIGEVDADTLMKDAKDFRDQLDEIPGMSALESLEANAYQALDDEIKANMREERIYAGEPDFQHESYSDSSAQSAVETKSKAEAELESELKSRITSGLSSQPNSQQNSQLNPQMNSQVKSNASSEAAFNDDSAEADSHSESSDDAVNAKTIHENSEPSAPLFAEPSISPDLDVTEKVEQTSEAVAPRAMPLNLDEHVPLLLDVEELGEDVAVHDEPAASYTVSENDSINNRHNEDSTAADTSNYEKQVSDQVELTVDDIEGIQSSVADMGDVFSMAAVDEEPASLEESVFEEEPVIGSGQQKAQDMMAQAAYAPVKKPGPNAEVLSERPIPSLVLVTHVVPHDEEGFCGEDILYLVNSCDLRHGEKGIFHRFEEEGGEGCIEFSMANSFNPGTFDPETLMHERIYGVSLFMSLPGPVKAMNAFESMTEMASVIARNLGGDVHDETHSIMALQTIEHNRQLVRDFVRKQKLFGKK
jgi:cell division protein ZipA